MYLLSLLVLVSLFCELVPESIIVGFPFMEDGFSWVTQVSTKVNKNVSLLKARKETLSRFSWIDGDFTYRVFFLKVVQMLLGYG